MTKNCVDIARPFVAELKPEHDIQVVGGVGSFAFKQPGVEIKMDEKLVVVGGDIDYSDIGQRRADGNLRDFDVLVRSADPDKIKIVEDLAKDTIGKDLIISVFGLHSMAKLKSQTRHPDLAAAKTWVSDRYVVEEEGEIVAAKKALFPFAVDMDLETLETWHLLLGNEAPIPIPHPGTVILNYLTRSISGLRAKDADKVQALAHNVLSAEPQLVDWITDGPGSSQLEMARILHSLREPKDAQTLTVGGKLEIAPYIPDGLPAHEAVMLNDLTLAALMTAVSRKKSRTLYVPEQNPQIVKVYQRYLEPLMGFVVRN